MDVRYAFGSKASGESGVGTTAQAGGEERLALNDMKLDIPDDDLELIIKALDHYHTYTAPGTTSLHTRFGVLVSRKWYLE
jgi:hypothetical protein